LPRLKGVGLTWTRQNAEALRDIVGLVVEVRWKGDELVA